MGLKEIFCQERAIGTLERALGAGREAHAYIFAGAAGVGKYKTAVEWGKLLLCAEPVEEDGFRDSCGRCESCRLVAAGTHPDFIHVYKELREFTEDGKGKAVPVEMPVDVIREFLVEKVLIKPTLSKRKIFVVSEAEKLNPSSQNAMLKVLEEPPAYCCIILLCTRLERLLPTTKSRCQIIRFGPIEEGMIVEKLKGLGLEDGAARYFAGLAEGSIGTACQWARLELEGAGLYAAKKEIVNRLAELKLADALEAAEGFLGYGKGITAAWDKIDSATSKKDLNRRALKTVVRMAASAVRDAMQVSAGLEERIVNSDQRGQIKKLAARLDGEGAAEKIGDCFEAMVCIDDAVNEKLIFERLLLNLAECGTMRV